MGRDASELDEIPFDTTDVDRKVGVPFGGGRLGEAIGTTVARRRARGMPSPHPHPLSFDEQVATIDILMTDQRGEAMASGRAEARGPAAGLAAE